MTIRENVPLAPLTTFGVGGPARVFLEVETEEELPTALAYARESGLPLSVLGAGSNVLVSDTGVEGVVLRIALREVSFQEVGDDTLLVAGAGTLWEEAVDAASAQGLFGIENLAGIPGTVGGAAVQNIGAYGAELGDTFEYADVIDSATSSVRRIASGEADFSYRSSLFKERPELIVTRVALRLKRYAQPNLAYADLARAGAAGVPLATPNEVAQAVRAIRAEKFPHATDGGCAGSFFKNPLISSEHVATLAERFPGLPVFPQEGGKVKVSLAWLLDHALKLKGYTKGNVRLYERQPLVIVAREGATAREVSAFADEIAARVFETTHIAIEREVEMFGAR